MTNSDYIFRAYQSKDIFDCKDIWEEVFGDKEEYILRFLELLPRLGTGAVAEYKGHAVAMAYTLCGIEYEGKSCAYLYAVATLPEHRGKGLGEKCSTLASELSNAEIICTMPAEEGLYSWYGRIMGLSSRLYVREEEIIPEAVLPVTPISAAQYAAMRETLLEGTVHARFPESHFELLEALCRCYGGGLYRCGETIMAVQASEKFCMISEIIGKDCKTAASSLAAFMGREKNLCRLYDKNGTRPFIAYAPNALPQDIIWGAVYD